MCGGKKYVNGKLSTLYFGTKQERDKWGDINFQKVTNIYFAINAKHSDHTKPILRFKFLFTWTHKATFT